MIAILTKYLPATNFKGSRIKAYTSNSGQSVTIGYPHDLNSDDAHKLAAQTLMRKMKWSNEIIGGGTNNGTAWVMIPTNQKLVDC
jgi:hypothetical protein